MANDLTDNTTDTTRAAPRVRGTGLCSWCVIGNHAMCTGVGCYGCEQHQRKPGVSGLADEPIVRTGERPRGDATVFKPAHRRGRA